MKIDNRERELQILNNEPLYRFWKSTGLSIKNFLKEYKGYIDKYLRINYPNIYE